MAEQPTKWAMERAVAITLAAGNHLDNIALALDEARRQGMEEVAKWLAPNFPAQARDMVHTLATREPTDD